MERRKGLTMTPTLKVWLSIAPVSSSVWGPSHQLRKGPVTTISNRWEIHAWFIKIELGQTLSVLVLPGGSQTDTRLQDAETSEHKQSSRGHRCRLALLDTLLLTLPVDSNSLFQALCQRKHLFDRNLFKEQWIMQEAMSRCVCSWNLKMLQLILSLV